MHISYFQVYRHVCVCVDLEPVLFQGRPIFGSDSAVGTYGVLSHIGQ